MAQAGVMHEDVHLQTYTDFGQNKGRYVVDGRVNALLQYIREEVDKGIVINYTDGTPSYTISNEQGMIDYSGTFDNGALVAISPSFTATVYHNGSNNASYAEREVGGAHAINYNTIDIRDSNVYRLAPLNQWGNAYDYMLQRQSKIVTDADYNPVTGITDMNSLDGKHLYHSGAGTMGIWREPEGLQGLAGAYSFIIGGIVTIKDAEQHANTTNISIHRELGYGNGIGASIQHPLPNATKAGDSGSPIFIYNEETQQYEYLAAHQSGGGNSYGQARGDVVWTHETLSAFNVTLNTGQDGTVRLGTITSEGDYHVDSSNRAVQEYLGTATNSSGEVIGTYSGIRSGLSTWSDLSNEKDKQNWYAYSGHLERSVPELFFNDNLVFVAEAEENTIELQGTVDLGVGYVQFDRGELEKAKYTIVAPEGSGYLLNSAGYVINEGVEVHISFTNPSDHMYEWRKIGAGDLYIEGSGDTNALLTLGGQGSTYLNRTSGYAAYNVLASSGARVVISNTSQIARDFTFGSGGGTLDMNGNSMDWYLSNTDVQADGFSINALTEEAIISNTSGNATLTYKESGNATFLGSFQDSETGSLSIDYQGGGVLTLNSIHTDLSNNAASGLTVSNGKVVLVGTNTVHGMGSLNGWSGQRLVKSDDWHYADAAMNVTVRNGATFELGSHARLTGDVTVAEGATFIMREGVKNRMEYVEGGAFLEDTTCYAAFFGLKGNVELAGNMRVEFSEGVSSTLTYNGNISGAGSLEINLGTSGGMLELGGDNSGFTGTKTIESGGVVLLNAEAMGDTSTNKWVVSTDAWISNRSSSSAQLLAAVDESSTGTLALWSDTSEQLDMSRHEGLTLGAVIGRTVQYGELGTQEELDAVQGAWRFGGGGGELVVNYKLSGENNLILGASGHSSGVVTLTNTENDFSGDITFIGKGIVLNTVEGALGNSEVHLTYGNGFGLTSADSITKNLGASSEGMVTVDAVSNQSLDMSGNHSLAIAAEKDVEFSGGITLASGQGYLFSSAVGGKLTLLSELDSSRSLVVDAQGVTGGTVVLAGNDSWSGDITVRGHRDNNGEGEISLLLGQDMTSAGGVTLSRGGILDLAGHSLTLIGTLSGDGGVLTNSGATGELIFDCSASELSSTANLNASNIRKIGSNVLSLGGNNGLRQFYVDAGTLRLTSDGAFASGSTVHLGDGTTLDNRTHALNANVTVSNGAAQIISSNNDKIVIRGDVNLADGVQLTIGGSNIASVTLSGETIGTNGSSLIVNANQLTLDRQSDISINSDLVINGNATIYSSGSADAMGRNFERIIVNGGKLTIGEESWSTVWNINSLEGSGELYWESTTNHYSSSRLILKGDSDFDGTISLNRTYNEWASRTHGAFLELASDFAAAKARINLTGRDSNSVASLAINTDNAHIKGLSGNVHSFVYAGASRVDTALSGSARPETTRAATLTIDTAADSNYTFSGTLGNTTDTRENGISLVKTGSGTQKLDGASVVLSNVSALAGTLNITSSALTVSGSVALACGAELKLGDSFSLNEGQKLYLLAGEENSGSAVLNSALVFNGGSITIDARGLSEASPMLALGGSVSMNSSFDGSCQFDFTNTSLISYGTDYLVSTGDWNLLNNRISTVTDDYVNATFTATATGLSVMFSMKDGHSLWDGDEGLLQQDNNVVFNSLNGVTSVNLTENAELGGAYFNNAEDVSINGAALSVNFLQKQDSGALVLNADVSAESMLVKDATTISGTGSLTVGSLSLQDDITTRMAVQVDNLQANGVAWTVDGTDNAFTQRLTLEQLDTTGGVKVEGQATLELQVQGGNYANPRTLGVEIGGTGYISLVGNGSLLKTQQQHINLSHAQLTDLILKGGGSTDISGEVDINGRLSVGHETLSLTEGAQVTVTHFRGGDTADNQPSIVTIEEGASLKVTGQDDGDNTSATFLLSHWKNSYSSLVLNGGTITSENARLHMGWDSGGRFDALSGEATLKGIFFSSQRYQADTLVLGEARLNIGSGGITGIGSNDTVQFGDGTIAATANFSISGNKAIDLVGTTNGTVFDTAGHTITVNTALAGNGNLVKTGNGTLNLAAATSLRGDVTLQAGTLQISNNSGTTELAHLAGEGMLTKTGSGSLTLNTATISTIVLQGSGQTDFTGDVNISEQLSIGNQTVNIQSGAVVTTSRLTASDRGSYVSSTININGGALNITGTVNNANTQNSFFLTHWTHSTSVLNLYSGMLNAVGAVLNTSWDSRGSFNAIGGEANLLGINLLGHEFSGRNGAFTLGSQDEGSAVVRIGSMGITGLTGGASVTLGNGTIAAAANFSISGDKAINLVGTTNGTVFDTAGHTITVNTALAGNGNLNKAGDGTLNLNASTAQYAGNVNINGGTLMLGSNALGVLTSGSELVVNKGGKLDLSAAGRSANLSRVSGAGTVVLNYGIGDKDNGSGFDFSGLTGEVQVDRGRVLLSSSVFGDDCPDFRLTSANSQLVFDGIGTVVNSNVHLDVESTDIHVNDKKSGTIGGDITGNSLVKRGAGSLTVGGNVKLDSMLKTADGQIILTGTQNSVANVDCSMGRTAKGTLRLAQNSHTTVTGDIWARANNTSILLENGASLTNEYDSVTFTNKGAVEEATLRYIGTTNEDEYSIADAWELTGGHLTYTGGDATINNKFVSSSVENAGGGLLTVNNSQNSLVGLNAASGSILVQNLAELDLKNLEIANSLSVSAYADGSQSAAAEARISVSEIASFGTGVTLNADLVMKAGSSLNMAGSVQMGSDVRLETGLSLTGSLYDEVKSMKVGESVTLFTGVDALYLGSSQEAITSITLEDGVLAKDYFTNLSDNYFLIYDTTLGEGLGELSIGMVVPEPTTATLSLVALAALAMRRRRK